MFKKIFSLVVLLFACAVLQAQTTITYSVQPDGAGGIDATVDQGNSSTNFGTSTSFKNERYLNSSWYNKRSYLSFNLSSIPANANVISATLSLYGINHTGANASYLTGIMR